MWVIECVALMLSDWLPKFNVGSNMNPPQISQFAKDFVRTYEVENIEDLRLCLSMALQGHFGKVYKVDGSDVGGWFKQYLELKYQEKERQERERKKKPIEPPVDKSSKVVSKERHDYWVQRIKTDLARIGKESEKKRASVTRHDTFADSLKSKTREEIIALRDGYLKHNSEGHYNREITLMNKEIDNR